MSIGIITCMKDERNKILARNIKAERYRKGITQAELAEKLTLAKVQLV